MDEPMKEPRYGTPDDENPEWTADDFARARPAKDVLPAAFLEAHRRRRGAQKAPTKQAISLRVDPDVLAHYKSMGRFWQRRMNEALRAGMERRRPVDDEGGQ